MGIFDKLFHRHKEDDIFGDMGKDPFGKEPSAEEDRLGLQSSSPIPESPPEETPSHDPFATQPPESPVHPGVTPTTPTAPGTVDRDIELVSSKLDTIKAILTSMDQRIAKLEKAAGVEEKKMPW